MATSKMLYKHSKILQINQNEILKRLRGKQEKEGRETKNKNKQKTKIKWQFQSLIYQ